MTLHIGDIAPPVKQDAKPVRGRFPPTPENSEEEKGQERHKAKAEQTGQPTGTIVIMTCMAVYLILPVKVRVAWPLLSIVFPLRILKASIIAMESMKLLFSAGWRRLSLL